MRVRLARVATRKHGRRRRLLPDERGDIEAASAHCRRLRRTEREDIGEHDATARGQLDGRRIGKDSHGAAGVPAGEAGAADESMSMETHALAGGAPASAWRTPQYEMSPVQRSTR